ncbi:MAG: preprotein translocase subunit SecY [Bacteroidota bacterium]|jgi:preprotein translocase subunit SecY
MKKIITKLKQIWSIDDLRIRIINTLGLLLIYRIGSFITLPGIDPNELGNLAEQGSGGLFGLLNMFAGGAFSRASIFALGIMPYISASIIVQLLTVAVPYFQRMQKEGEDGRNKMNQITRYLTIIVTALQSIAYLTNLQSEVGTAIYNPGVWFSITSVVIMIAGTMFVMWLGERITDKGLGNGISLIIMVGIISRFPGSLFSEIGFKFDGKGGGLVIFLVEMFALISVIAIVIMLVQGTRKIPVNYAKRVQGNRQFGGMRQYLPMKVNATGVMPIIFAQALMFIPITVAQFLSDSEVGYFLQVFSDNTSLAYNLTFALLIIVFTYFYTAITVNPTQIADDLKKNNGFIPGIKPGKNTSDFIDNVMSRITLPGSLFLALVAIFPSIAIILGVNNQFADFFGGTSLLIMVGVVLDTLQQIESHLLMRHYDGFVKSGIKGRSVPQTPTM